MLICGSKKGKIFIYQLATGHLIAEVPNAHYLAINDLALSHASDAARQADLIVSGGSDSKVKIWSLSALLSHSTAPSSSCYHEFGEHTAPVTSV